MTPAPAGPEPPHDCRRCPRLATFRDELRGLYPDYFNGPAPSFGAERADLLIVGLAPGLHGANKTGRPFTGDYAGDLLYEALSRFGFSEGQYGAHANDGLRLRGAMITNAVRCVPPKNKPVGAEIKACRAFLAARFKASQPRAAIALGRIAHESVISAFGLRRADHVFAHGARHEVGADAPVLFDSYHCSRYNTNTGRLTPEMFFDVFAAARAFLDARPRA